MSAAISLAPFADVDQALRREWIDTNGRGGFACSSILACNTRKYHGLLVAQLAQPAGRFVMLSRMDFWLRVDGELLPLSTAAYPDVLHPRGYENLVGFEYDSYPRITYHVGKHRVRWSCRMVDGEDTVLLRLDLLAGPPVAVVAEPLLAARNAHYITRENSDFDASVSETDGVWRVQPYASLPAMYMDCNGKADFEPQAQWHYNVVYAREQERGFPYEEDLCAIGCFDLQLTSEKPLILRVSLQPPSKSSELVWERETARRDALLAAAQRPGEPAGISLMRANSRQFLVTNSRGERSIVAGYPWFVEWGRDTMIALPGLTLNTGREDEAMAILANYASHERNGLIPNFLADDGSLRHAYNSVDASLWFFRATEAYARHSGNWQAVADELGPSLTRIVEAYLEGRVPNAHLDNGLIWAGDAHTQLTWMDAKSRGQAVTPRHGFAVELNALWLNGLAFLQDLAAQTDFVLDPRALAEFAKGKARFAKVFWSERYGWLADCVNENGQDCSLRPNQLYAVALPFSPLNKKQQLAVVKAVREHLATPCGLRTLAPEDPRYVGRYEGNGDTRDAAYHQGTAWGWLVGPYVEASLKVARNPRKTARELQTFFAPLWGEHLHDAGIAGIAEIFDGDAPHTARGCITQAWSVAEALRAWDLIQTCMSESK
jgi:predicted glycogen debranching enzyme